MKFVHTTNLQCQKHVKAPYPILEKLFRFIAKISERFEVKFLPLGPNPFIYSMMELRGSWSVLLYDLYQSGLVQVQYTSTISSWFHSCLIEGAQVHLYPKFKIQQASRPNLGFIPT